MSILDALKGILPVEVRSALENELFRSDDDSADQATPDDQDVRLYNANTGVWEPRSLARAQLVLTTAQQWATTGGGVFDTLIQTGNVFSAFALNKFTHSAGILTYTGSGETMPYEFALSAVSYATHDVDFGPSVDDGDPAIGQTGFFSVQTTYARGFTIRGFLTLATGATLRMKLADKGAGGNIAPRIGSRLVIG